MRQIYITGAQSVGKTTLVKQLQRRTLQPQQLISRHDGRRLELLIVDEVARGLIKREGTDLAVFQDYRSHEAEFYEFNMKLVRYYLEMLHQDRAQNGSSSTAGEQHDTRLVKLYDRSGLDAINYIATYLPHLEDKMMAEQCVNDLLTGYAEATGNSGDISMVVVHPCADFVVHDDVRLPPRLEELQAYTAKLRRLLHNWGIPWLDVTDACLMARTAQLVELIEADHRQAPMMGP